MSRIFATKVWGFDPTRWSVLGFSYEGNRNTLAAELLPDDWVLHIGTRVTGETAEADRGKLLGMARLSESHIATKDGVEAALWAETLSKNGGHAKWPHALPMVEARRLISPPDEYEIFKSDGWRRLGLMLGTRAIQISDDEADLVMSLPWRPVDLYDSPSINAAKDAARTRAAVRGRRRGFFPVATGDRSATYENRPAATYVMELTGPAAGMSFGSRESGARARRAYKIGWCYEPQERERQLNFGFVSLTHLSWNLISQEVHRDGAAAIAMEQDLLQRLSSRAAHGGGTSEVVICMEHELSQAWREAVIAARVGEEIRPHDASQSWNPSNPP